MLKLFGSILLAGLALVSPVLADLQRDPSGFTVIPVAADSRLIYVSSSTGNDGNSGLDPTTPVQSFDAARRLVRDGSSDRILLKAGDVFGQFGNLAFSGRSADQPIVLGVYGNGPRPRIECYERAINFDGRRRIDNIAIVGIEFVVPWRDVTDARYNPEQLIQGRKIVDYDSYALRVLTQGSSNLLFEDCVFRAFREGPQLFAVTNLTIRRCMFLDSWSAGGKSQGLYIEGSSNVLVEENLFDHNGWGYDQVTSVYSGARPNIFNHNLYAQSNNRTPITYTGNITARASSHGVQLRTGGAMTNNLFIRDSIAGFCSTNPSVIANNVVVGGKDIDQWNRRGWGLSVINLPSATIQDNIVCNKVSGVGDGWPYQLQFDAMDPKTTSITFTHNISYAWGYNQTSNPNNVPGNFAVDTNQYDDPARDEQTYAATIGVADFLLAARARQRGDWPLQLTASAVNNYIRLGYRLPDPRRDALEAVDVIQLQVPTLSKQLDTIRKALILVPTTQPGTTTTRP